MSWQVRKVAVLGSGVMGSAIAAHFANSGVPSLVLDIVPDALNEKERAAGWGLDDRRVRDRIARDSVAGLRKLRPTPLFVPERLAMIETGNLVDDLAKLAEVDWVIEAVREDMAIKHNVLAAVAPHLSEHAVLSTNTSGLALGEMASVLPATVRRRFLGTHFFNPPRYMRLLELIPTADTDPEIVERVEEFAVRRLGKGVVRAKDTINFIANRVGVHSMIATLGVMDAMSLTVEEVDAVTGPAIGRPKTATFRLADLVGIDTLLFVARNVYANARNDETREAFRPPDWLEKMVEAGLLGRKAGAGFYRKERDGEIKTLDLETLEYRAAKKPDFPELKPLRGIASPVARLQALGAAEGRGAEAAWRVLAATFSYSAMRLGEIVDDAATLDRAMVLGFNWELGPFATWDAIGFRSALSRIREAGLALPEWVSALEAAGDERLFLEDDGVTLSPAAVPGQRVAVAEDPRTLRFVSLHRAGRVVRENESASLVDLGDDVLGLEFHSKMNAIDGETIAMIEQAAAEAETNWAGLVLANDGANFSAGANLELLARGIEEQDWDAVRTLVRSFQGAINRIAACAVPVVVAPHGMALGGGCEVVLGADAIRAAAESYVGLVEVGAGLIPAGGGCLRLYKRNLFRRGGADDLPGVLTDTFQTIGMAKVSGSAEEAQRLGFLRSGDGWSMSREHVLSDAKALVLSMARAGYVAPLPERSIPVLGRGGIALVESMWLNMLEGRFISEHDRTVGHQLAWILSGGNLQGPTTVSEERMLELEVEAFLRLSGEPKTHERIMALLKTGKPLRN
jgi:3-hydroxyacyl-CoA dehydrogenase